MRRTSSIIFTKISNSLSQSSSVSSEAQLARSYIDAITLPGSRGPAWLTESCSGLPVATQQSSHGLYMQLSRGFASLPAPAPSDAPKTRPRNGTNPSRRQLAQQKPRSDGPSTSNRSSNTNPRPAFQRPPQQRQNPNPGGPGTNTNRPNGQQQTSSPRPRPQNGNNNNNSTWVDRRRSPQQNNNNNNSGFRPRGPPSSNEQHRPSNNSQTTGFRPRVQRNDQQQDQQQQGHYTPPSSPASKPNYTYKKKAPAINVGSHWLYKDKPAPKPDPQYQRPWHQTPASPFKKPTTATSKKKKKDPEKVKQVVIPENVTVIQLANLLGKPVDAVEKVLSDLGDAPRSTQETVAPDSAELAALEFDRVAIFPASSSTSAAAVPRPPVVTVMGHVDHGKTSLLDALRSTSVAAKEAGGITQHIGAFEVALIGSKQTVTFIDTPGHAAFTAMRARGAAVTDVVVLVVAADDGVMPQTREALAHAQAAGCPIVVAITKCDLASADPSKVRKQLIAQGVELEELGGNIQVVEVAATKGEGLEDLEEAVVLQAEMLELKADPTAAVGGVVVEAKMMRGQGPVATMIVTKGTLKVGQSVVIGTEWGKIKALKNASGVAVKQVLPGQPAEIVGLRGLPLAGDDVMGVVNEDRAQRVSKARTDRAEWRRHSAMARFVPNLDADADDADAGPCILPIVLKADVSGSVEAVREAIASMSSDAVQVKVVHAGVGPVSLSDVQLAVPSGARVIGFNVRPSGSDVEAEAKRHGVELVCRRVIYELIDDIATAVTGATPKQRKEIVTGTAEVLQVFPLTAKRGNKEVQQALVAGCRVSDGSMSSSLQFRVVRGGETVHTGRCSSIRRHKLSVETVGKGTECGILLDDFQDIQLGDVIECIDEKYE